MLQAILPKGADFPYAFFYLIAVFVVAWRSGYASRNRYVSDHNGRTPLAARAPFSADRPQPPDTVVRCLCRDKRVAQSQRRIRGALRKANEELDHRVQERTQELQNAVEALESEVEQHKTTENRLQTQLERLNLLDQLTRAIGERQDLASVYQVVVRRLEDNLPVDFGCVCLYDAAAKHSR